MQGGHGCCAGCEASYTEVFERRGTDSPALLFWDGYLVIGLFYYSDLALDWLFCYNEIVDLRDTRW